MDESDFEGTLVLEKLGEIGKVEDFFDAVDSDEFKAAKSLMKLANIDAETISLVLKKMGEVVEAGVDFDSKTWWRKLQ